MVERVSPSYYAEGQYYRQFNLTGYGFPLIPDDAWCILSDDNDDPLKYQSFHDNNYRLIITSKTAREMHVVHFFGTYTMQAVYFGAILSPDRETVLWVNNTKPLP